MTSDGLNKAACLRYWYLGFIAILLMACGGGSNSSSGSSTLKFQIAWDRSESGSNFQIASLSDCYDIDLGNIVETVTAEIFNANGELIGSGEWGCMEGSGIIAGLPANQWVTIAVAGYPPSKDPNPPILYFGQTEAFLTPGTVDAGTIVAGRFTPVMIAPANESTINSYAVALAWQEVPTAAGYLVRILDDSVFSRDITISDGRTTSYQLTDLLTGNYTWSVQAIDRAGNLGVMSAFWQFSFNQLQIAGVTFTDFGITIPNPTTTTVEFWDWGMEGFELSYSEAQSVGITESWYAPIDLSEFSELQQIILENNLMQQTDVILEDGMEPCAGWLGMEITIALSDESSHVFLISPQVCFREDWPAPVRDLVLLRDRLVEKYDPSNY